MSVDDKTAKATGPQASAGSSVQLSDGTGPYDSVSVMMEESAATPDFAGVCPVPGTAASPKHTSTDRGHENNVNRKNSFHSSKQQQQTRLTKRRYTTTSGFKHPTSGKRRRRANSESDSVLPTNFLLGGNIFDPLNLNSLLDEEVNKALNAETPKTSPLPAKSRDPVEILIPRDIRDPLNLNSGFAEGSLLVSPFKSGGRKRHRNRHHGGGVAGVTVAHIGFSELEKSEVKSSTSMTLPGVPASCTSTETTKESNSLSSVTADSHEHMATNPTPCKEESLCVSVEEATLSLSAGTTHQHPNKRRRRRNSCKTELPVDQSTPCNKVQSTDRSSFHTPRTGPRHGPGVHPQPHSQGKEHQKKFQFGNYNKYYGYRNPGCSEDPRIHVLLREWFEGKQVLDLGCNSGHLTLYIAKMFRPTHILGLDIDGSLIHAARKNIRHYLSELQTHQARRAGQGKKTNADESTSAAAQMQDESQSSDDKGTAAKEQSCSANAMNDNDSKQVGKPEQMEQKDGDSSVSCFCPVSLLVSRGPIAAPPLTETCSNQPGEFPSNVSFIKANYVLDNDSLLLTQRAEYDVILCLSVTKWVHLNWGDSGLKRLFKRAYKHLRHGGMFILEPQPWESYVRRKKLTDNINRNFRSIRFKPDQFSTYLTTEVGFTSFEHLGAPKSSVRGFQRPIYVFHK